MSMDWQVAEIKELRLRIGYGLVFPDSDFCQIFSAALVDISVTPNKSLT